MLPALQSRSRPGFTSKTIDDVDAMPAAVADGIELEYVTFEPKHFSVRWTVARRPPFVVQFGRADVAVVRRLRAPAGRCVFLVPLFLPSSPRWNGNIIEGDEMVVCWPGTETSAIDPPRTEFAAVSVELDVAAFLVEEGPRALERRDRSHVVQLQAVGAADLRQRLVKVLRFPGLSESAADLFDSLAEGLRSARPSEDAARPTAHTDVVRRAEDYVERNSGRPVSVARLSTIAGVSERSLRNAFYNVYMTGPKRYLKVCQLHRVRHSLRAPSHDGVTVTDVATLHGFFELGRFAGEYRAFFGETPSQTLNRAKCIFGANPQEKALFAQAH